MTPEVVGVLRVFATALLDIPEHRRTPLYTKLLLTLNEGHFLWAFLALVFETHVLHPSPENSNTGTEYFKSKYKLSELCSFSKKKLGSRRLR